MRINTNAWNRIRYSLLAPVYDRIAPFRAQRRRSMELLAPRDGERVLLSGAGTGADLDHLPPGPHVTAVDIAPAMVERVRSRAARLGREVDARVGDAQTLDLPDASVDAVILHLIVAVAPDGARVVAEAARVLRPGGRAVIFDKFVPDRARPSLPRRLLNVATNFLFSDVTRRLGPMLVGTGLRIVHREPTGIGGQFEIVLLEKGARGGAWVPGKPSALSGRSSASRQSGRESRSAAIRTKRSLVNGQQLWEDCRTFTLRDLP